MTAGIFSRGHFGWGSLFFLGEKVDGGRKRFFKRDYKIRFFLKTVALELQGDLRECSNTRGNRYLAGVVITMRRCPETR